ncbi:MAG: SDR family oxidoreductase [Proteobacteria bacterium]|nr:SDR family oxidoreductase [Burkholderiales bacterium]
MDLELAGKTALITGGSRGIGFAIAQCLAREGCNLHLASRSAEDLDAARTKLAPERAITVQCHALDLGLSANIAKLVDAVGDVDILINNAGAIPQGSLLAVDEEHWRQAWELKVFGYINLTRAVYAKMKARRKGVIVNIIGSAGERPTPNYIAGSTGNASLMAFSRALGGESVDHGVRVVGLNPGSIETDRQRVRWQERAQARFGDPSRWPELVTDAPMGRLGKPEEVADVAVFLASARASYVSGTIVTVDAGKLSRNPAA